MTSPLLPTDIHAFLGRRVLGQDEVLRRVSVSLYKHINGLSAPNILLIGNSGTGKTTLMEAVAALYDSDAALERFRVMCLVNAATLAPELPGEDRITRILRRLETRAKALWGPAITAGTLARALEHATVCLDEVDKISGRMAGASHAQGVAAQYALLTALEGERLLYRATILEDGREVAVDLALDTSRMLFVCGGAFEELYDQVYAILVNRRDDRRLREVSEVTRHGDGSMSVRTVARFELREALRLADLFAYGMMPQFVSRFGTIAVLRALGPRELRAIMETSPQSPLARCRDYLAHMGVALEVTEAALDAVAEAAAKNGRIGARALREVFGALLAPHEYDPLHSPNCVATEHGPVLTLDRDDVLALARDRDGDAL